MINTYSLFYYGIEVDADNYQLAFSEGGGPEILVELSWGLKTLNQLAEELEDILNEFGALTYTVTVNRSTRIMTIAASGSFSILFLTASVVTDVATLL